MKNNNITVQDDAKNEIQQLYTFKLLFTNI